VPYRRGGAFRHFAGARPTNFVSGGDLLPKLREAPARFRELFGQRLDFPGGLLGSRITAVPGASDVFIGGVVAYDNVVKSGMLDVAPELLAREGAVSEEVVSAMALGVQRQFAGEAALALLL